MTENDVVSQLGFAVENYSGGCPECGKLDRILNVGKVHWALCCEHKNKWNAGENCFDNWRDENEAIWRRNENLLRDFLEVEPLLSTNPAFYADGEWYALAMRDVLRDVEERRRLVSTLFTRGAA